MLVYAVPVPRALRELHLTYSKSHSFESPVREAAVMLLLFTCVRLAANLGLSFSELNLHVLPSPSFLHVRSPKPHGSV